MRVNVGSLICLFVVAMATAFIVTRVTDSLVWVVVVCGALGIVWGVAAPELFVRFPRR